MSHAVVVLPRVPVTATISISLWACTEPTESSPSSRGLLHWCGCQQHPPRGAIIEGHSQARGHLIRGSHPHDRDVGGQHLQGTSSSVMMQVSCPPAPPVRAAHSHQARLETAAGPLAAPALPPVPPALPAPAPLQPHLPGAGRKLWPLRVRLGPTGLWPSSGPLAAGAPLAQLSEAMRQNRSPSRTC
jgi:hypothetical protein